MTITDDMVTVFRLAALTEDLTPGEVAALERTARRLDREINKQLTPNRYMPAGSHPGNLVLSPPCTYSDDHDKATCPCRGDRVAVQPTAGWSRLYALAGGR